MDTPDIVESAESIIAQLINRGLASANPSYNIQSVIGNGAYGTVYRALDRRNNNRVVALKEVKVQSTDQGVPLNTLREITTLKQLNHYEHPNIVKLLDVFPSGRVSVLETKVTMVFEFVDQDLSAFLEKRKSPLSDSMVKEMSRQMLCGLDFLHANRICHRDLKPQNILVSKNNVLKLADFGLSRCCTREVMLTNVVVTLWYRSPEVLLQSHYATPVDVWSLGCIFGELYLRKALFCGQSDIDQLNKIFDVMGTPEPFEWPREVVIPITSFPKRKKRNLREVIPNISARGQKLLEAMLTFVPGDRISANKALQHPYFTESVSESEFEPSDESFAGNYTTDEESEVRDDLSAQAVRSSCESTSSEEFESPVESTNETVADSSPLTSPRRAPNILRHSSDKSHSKQTINDSQSGGNGHTGRNDLLIDSEEESVIAAEFLTKAGFARQEHTDEESSLLEHAENTSWLEHVKEGSLWLEHGRDFVDGDASASTSGYQKGRVVNHERNLSTDSEHVLELSGDSENLLRGRMSSIDQLLEAARQSEELSASLVSGSNPGEDTCVSENLDEIEAVNSLLTFSSGLIADNRPESSRNAMDSVFCSVGNVPIVGNNSTTDNIDHVSTIECLPDNDQISVQLSSSANNSSAVNNLTPSSNEKIDSTSAIPNDTNNDNANSQLLDGNSNIVLTKRKFDSDQVPDQPAKRRKV